jgi:hypothetical protein
MYSENIKYKIFKIDKKNLSLHLNYNDIINSYNGNIEIKIEDLSDDESLDDQIFKKIFVFKKKKEVFDFFKKNEGLRIPFFFIKEEETVSFDTLSLKEKEPDIYFNILEVDDDHVKIRCYCSLFKKQESEYPHKTYDMNDFIKNDSDLKDVLFKICENDIVDILNSEKELKTEISKNVLFEKEYINFIN